MMDSFDAAARAPAVCDYRLPEAARPRLSRQCAAILERLKQGNASADELRQASGARNLTARISNLRYAGIGIECFDLNQETGESWYRLKEPNPGAGT